MSAFHFITSYCILTKSLNIVIIGTGNVATHLVESFQKLKQVKLVQAFNHQISNHSKDFSKKFKCIVVTDYAKIRLDADLYIIAVKDDSIAEVAKNLTKLELKGLVLHTSGSVDCNVLKKVSNQIGVYYPLQTFYPGAKIDWSSTPLLIEANTKTALTQLKSLANAVSKTVRVIKSEERLRIHLAAVFASNFTNAMYVAAYELIEESLTKKDTALLFPLMKHSFQKLEIVHPLMAQTGPAMRQDKDVMQKHLSLLKGNRELSVLYRSLSDLILKQQSSKK